MIYLFIYLMFDLFIRFYIELMPTEMSPSRIYRTAGDKIKENADCKMILGENIKTHGLDSRGDGRRY